VFDSIFIILALLFIKHWYIDFVNQTMEEIVGKGIYGNFNGVMHSAKHGIGTAIIICLVTGQINLGLMLGFLDFVLHYHIDWAKININKRWNYTPADHQFWTWLGADQLAHSLTYLFIVWKIF
jgi:hypothetical protein